MIVFPSARPLAIAWGVQLISGCLWVMPLITSERGNLALLPLFVLYILAQALCVAVALWFAFRRPELRAQAVSLLWTSLLIFIVPLLVRSLVGAPFPGVDPLAATGIAMLALPLAGLVLLPGRAARLLPGALWSSRRVNLGLCWMLAAVLGVNLVTWAIGGGVIVRGALGVRATGKYVDALFLACFSATGVAMAVAILLMPVGYLGILQTVDRTHRGLHAMLLALCLVLALVAAAELAAVMLVFAAAAVG
jgi:hypothetical protein